LLMKADSFGPVGRRKPAGVVREPTSGRFARREF
jgi:hypothetical protein